MGLRLKFNAAVVPVVAIVLGLVVWADQRHEFDAIMNSHALHAVPAGAIPSGPIDPATLPETVARGSLRIHVLYGALLMLLVAASVNGALHLFVFRPLDRMRRRLARIGRGHWRDAPEAASGDELGQFARSFDLLGLEIGAVLDQALHADRLAVAALLSRHLAARIEPELQAIARVAAACTGRNDAADRATGERLARSAASILSTTRGLDRLFPPDSPVGRAS